MTPQHTSVYLMRVIGTDYYKVGISRNVRARRRSIQSAMPFSIELVRSIDHEHAAQIEDTIHAALHAYHIRGEWFACIYDEICQVFDRCAVEDGADTAIPTYRKLAPRIRLTTPAMITEVRNLAEYHQMSHGHIARLLGISRTTVSNILNAKRRFST